MVNLEIYYSPMKLGFDIFWSRLRLVLFSSVIRFLGFYEEGGALQETQNLLFGTVHHLEPKLSDEKRLPFLKTKILGLVSSLLK
jgi:hypothetical protein